MNEPDEGCYSEIARRMIETGNRLVPQFWDLPHLDKPPMACWLAAASMKLFGQNEWAAGLPVALKFGANDPGYEPHQRDDWYRLLNQVGVHAMACPVMCQPEGRTPSPARLYEGFSCRGGSFAQKFPG